MSEILDACSDLPLVHFAPGETLLTEGGTDGRLYVLISGEVVVLKGETEVARVSSPGAVFGEISALLDTPYSATVRASGAVTARRSDAAAEFIAGNPAVALHTARILAQRLNAATAYLADIKSQFSDQKNHFGMMDRILDTLLQRQPGKPPPPTGASDPRL